MTIFDLLREDTDEVIDLINYFINSQEEEKPKEPVQYDGFWDM